MSTRIVVVTGASGALGRAVVQTFREAGDTVVTISRSGSDVSADLTDPAQAEQAFDSIISQHGRIDVLVHTVGAFAPSGNIAGSQVAVWEKMMALNFQAALYVLKNAVPHMTKARRGRIIAVGSRAGMQPSAGLGAYAVSKTAMHTLVQTVAAEVRDAGITANVVLPGTMRTEANAATDTPGQADAWTEPSSVAGLIFWLASDAAEDVSGALIPIYGRS